MGYQATEIPRWILYEFYPVKTPSLNSLYTGWFESCDTLEKAKL